ncbi:MAG: hypothetical protein ABWX92_12390 [Mycetocola sp.]
MALTDSFPGPSGLTDSIEAGKDIAALLKHNSDGTPKAGLTYKPATNLVTARGDLRVDIGAFKAVLVRAGAVRLLANDADAQSPDFTVPTANSRIDVLYVKVGEISQSDAADGPFFGILEGVAAAIPSKPVLAIDGALELAAITIPSTATATNSVGVAIAQTAATTGAFTASGDDTGWITPALTGGWASSPSQTIQYRRYAGVVYLRGRGASGTAGTMFTLPAGFRPTQTMVVTVKNGVIPIDAIMSITVNTNGTVVSSTAGSFPQMTNVTPFIADA